MFTGRDTREWRAISQSRVRIRELAEKPARRVALALPAAVLERANREVAARIKPEPTVHHGITDTAGESSEPHPAEDSRLQLR